MCECSAGRSNIIHGSFAWEVETFCQFSLYNKYIFLFTYIFHGHYYNSYTYYILINTSGRPEKVLPVLSKRLPGEEADIQMSMEKLQAL